MSDFEILKYYQQHLVEILEERKKRPMERRNQSKISPREDRNTETHAEN